MEDSDAARVGEAAHEAYEAYGLVKPWPGVRIVRKGHPLLSDGSIGKAAMYESGMELIYIDYDYVDSKAILREIFMHEVAHVLAYRVHGPGIAEHGREFLATCTRVSPRNFCTAYLE